MPAQIGMLTGTNADIRNRGLMGSPVCECTADSYTAVAFIRERTPQLTSML